MAEAKVSKGATRVANAISTVLGNVAKQGNVITQCVTSLVKVYGGKPVPKQDVNAIANTVARLRGWSAASMAPRKSEVRKIIRQYPRIVEAVERYTATHNDFTWHTAMRLITCLHREPALNQALKLMDVSNAAKQITPIKACGSAVSRIMNLDTSAAKIVAFQNDLEALAEKHSINW
ncbi:MAG: hypothetical protein KAJ55_13160 [Anaerolineales bacterium]|nr:hypothetical protein [Anaerolineales bacterium]